MGQKTTPFNPFFSEYKGGGAAAELRGQAPSDPCNSNTARDTSHEIHMLTSVE